MRELDQANRRQGRVGSEGDGVEAAADQASLGGGFKDGRRFGLNLHIDWFTEKGTLGRVPRVGSSDSSRPRDQESRHWQRQTG